MSPNVTRIVLSRAFIPVILLAGYVAVGWLSNIYQVTDIYHENSLLENMQVGFLCLACIAFAGAGRGLQLKHKKVAAFLSLLMFAFIFRELDVERLEGAPDWAIYLFADDGRILYLLPLLGLFVWMMQDIKHYWQNWSRYINTRAGIYMACAVILLIVFSTAFDRGLIQVSQAALWEESSEALATTLLFAVSLVFNREMKLLEQK